MYFHLYETLLLKIIGMFLGRYFLYFLAVKSVHKQKLESLAFKHCSTFTLTEK